MKIARFDYLLRATLTASLLATSSSFAESGLFGYANFKAGYSHESFAKSVFFSTADDKSAYLNSSSAPSYPFGGSLGLGYNFTPSFGLRFEAEYIYRLGARFKEDEVHSTVSNEIRMRPQAQIQSLLGNVYLDYYVVPSVNLYLSAGAGMGLIKATIDHRNTNNENGRMTALKKSTFAWQAGGGIGIALSQSVGLDFNVRYVNFGKAKFDSTPKLPAVASLPFTAIEALAGLNCRF